VRALIAVAVIALAVTSLLLSLHQSVHRPAYVVIHRGQPMPRHYIEAWQFGNVTIVEVSPDSTTVTVAPWS
jgi:hypothetical protein